MKRLMVVSIAVVFVCTSALFAEISVGTGDMKVGAILQSRYDYSLVEDEDGINGQFTLNRARLLVSGSVSSKVKYFIQTEFMNSGSTTGILDYKMILVDYIPKTSIIIGRFLPAWTKYMPMHTGKLDFINYPLFVSGGGCVSEYGGASAAAFDCGDWAVWRQVGFQTDTNIENDFGMWKFNVGLFNGMGTNNIHQNNTSDANDAKDVLVGAHLYKPIPASKIHVGLNAWLGNLLLTDDADKSINMFGGILEYMGKQITVGGEVFMKTIENPVEGEDDFKSMGFYGQGKYMINPEWGVLARYDFVDPDTDSEAEKDAETWITVGVNHYIESWHAMIYLNYIMKMEQDDWGAPESIDNDLIVLQFQVAP